MKYVNDIIVVYVHLLVAAVVVNALTIKNLSLSLEYFWMVWAAFGWSIGLFSHSLSVFQIFKLFKDS